MTDDEYRIFFETRNKAWCVETLFVLLLELVCVDSVVRRLSTRHCPRLLLSAVLRRRCCWATSAVDQYLLPALPALSSKPVALRCFRRLAG